MQQGIHILRVPALAEIEIGEIAKNIAGFNNDHFAEFLHLVFTEMKKKCENHSRYQLQLKWTAEKISPDVVQAIDDILAFWNMEKNK